MIPRFASPVRAGRRKNGFSLVEVVMAVAIAALGIITVMGLIPHGLELSRKTGNEIAMTRIIQSIVSDVQQADWTQIQGNQAGIEGIRTFDDQGLEVAGSDLFVAYVADVALPLPDVALPTNGGTGLQANLRRVQIRVAASSTTNFDFNDAPVNSYRTFTQLIAKTR